MFKFITHRPLWVNILAGLILAVTIFLLIISSLGWLTRHNKTSTVPNVTGIAQSEAEAMLTKAGFRVTLLDSIYTDTTKPLAVLKQIPEAGEVVKAHRIIYLTINRAVPPTIEMPNLVGYSIRSAAITLQGFGLKLGDTTFRPDFAKNSVLEQRFNGRIVQPGIQVSVGSTISLVLGSGVGRSEFIVPVLTGLRFSEATAHIKELGLSFLSIIAPSIKDTANAYIYKQNPNRTDANGKTLLIRSGQTMDVWLQQEPIVDSTETNLEDNQE